MPSRLRRAPWKRRTWTPSLGKNGILCPTTPGKAIAGSASILDTEGFVIIDTPRRALSFSTPTVVKPHHESPGNAGDESHKYPGMNSAADAAAKRGRTDRKKTLANSTATLIQQNGNHGSTTPGNGIAGSASILDKEGANTKTLEGGTFTLGRKIFSWYFRPRPVQCNIQFEDDWLGGLVV